MAAGTVQAAEPMIMITACSLLLNWARWLARGIIGIMLEHYPPDEDLRNAQANFSLE
jgi:hypothetical protein